MVWPVSEDEDETETDGVWDRVNMMHNRTNMMSFCLTVSCMIIWIAKYNFNFQVTNLQKLYIDLRAMKIKS